MNLGDLQPASSALMRSLRGFGHIARLGIVVCASGGCATVEIPSSEALLTEDQIIDLMDHPQRWYGRTVTVQIYPYDNGFGRSYRVCFERCDSAYAERSPFVIYTRVDRFKGYRGDRPAVVTARYTSACVDLPAPGLGGRMSPLCPDLVTRAFTETD